jgi:hypothetical protein
MASSRDPVPASVFASDQHKPLVRFEETGQASNEPPASGSRTGDANKSLTSGSGTDLSTTLPDPEVMEIDEDAKVEPDPPAD